MGRARQVLVRSVGKVPVLDRALRRVHRALVPRPAPAPRRRRPAPPPPPLVRVALPSHPDGTPPTGVGHLTVLAQKQFFVAREVAAGGLQAYEPEALACMLAVSEVAGPGELLDVGANVGVYSCLAAACTPREVHAFEPTPALAAEGRRISGEAGLTVHVHELAASDRAGSATFYLSDRTDASNSLRAGFRPSSTRIEVEVDTIDALAQRHGWRPAVLKIDTEATEPDVLAGAERVLREHRPWVLCEVLAGRTEQRLMDVMRPHGYTWMHITASTSWAASDEITGDAGYHELMWLFAPEPPTERFWTQLRAWSQALASTAAPQPVATGT